MLVSHDYIFYTHFHLFVDPNVTFESHLLGHKLPSKTLPNYNMMLCSMRLLWCVNQNFI